MACNNCNPTSLSNEKYVVDHSVGFKSRISEEKKFPYWILLGIPLILIPLMKKKK